MHRDAVEWSPTTPELTPLNFFFSVKPSEILYQTCPRDTEKLKERIKYVYNKLTGNESCRQRIEIYFEKKDILKSRYNN